jgi:hypothetical protein
LISGTPTTAGNSTADITATNAGGTSPAASIRFTITERPVPEVTSATLNGTIGALFNHTINATNSPTGFSMVSGTFPRGLFLNTRTGLITGTPTKRGTFEFGIRATNAGGNSTTANITISILPQVPVNRSAFSTIGTIGKAFRYQITASNSPTSYSVSEPLPVGLSLNATSGLISGTPTEAGNATITISAYNGGGLGSRLITIRILPQAPVITSAATVNGSVGSAFSHQVTASNSPTSYSVSGSLPPGLTLDGATGLISGTPTRIGHRKITVRAVNAGGTGVKIIRIVIKRSALF